MNYSLPSRKSLNIFAETSSSKWRAIFKDLHIYAKRVFVEISLVVEDNYGLSQITRDRAGLATNHKSRT